MSIHRKSHAREGRGKGNGCSDKWYNSPLWDNVGPDANKPKETKENTVAEDSKDIEQKEESLREKQRRMYSMAY